MTYPKIVDVISRIKRAGVLGLVFGLFTAVDGSILGAIIAFFTGVESCVWWFALIGAAPGVLLGMALGLYKLPPVKNVTLSPECNFSSFCGTVWKTKVKVAVATIQQGSRPASVYLLEPHSFDPAHPKYTPPYGMQIIEVLPAGTRLRIERLLMKENFNWIDLWVTASLDDGKIVRLSVGLLAKNRFIWSGWSDSKDWGVDPDMLEKAE